MTIGRGQWLYETHSRYAASRNARAGHFQSELQSSSVRAGHYNDRRPFIRRPCGHPMTTAAIMQPTYLGWSGYYALLDQADIFILDDTSHVNLKSWQMRNRIRTKGGQTIWLSIPTNAKRGMPLNQVQVIDNGWHLKHLRTIQAAYGRTPGFPALVEPLGLGLTTGFTGLTGMTGYLIQRLADLLGITTRIVRASDLGSTRPNMHERIVDLCTHVDADVLINTPTAKEYLHESQLEGIRIAWTDYHHPQYRQGGQEWASHLSVIDLLAHCGKDSLNIIRGNPTGNLHSSP